MKHLQHLSLEETRALKEVIASLSERAKQPLSLNSLLQRWSNFVLQVERGYVGSIYEYINDLSVRDLLEEVTHKVPLTLCDNLLKLIRPWDERFNGATRKLSRSLSPAITQDESFDWWFRVPNKLDGELNEDLRSEGFFE